MYSSYENRRLFFKLLLIFLYPLLFATPCAARPATPHTIIYYNNQPPDANGNYEFAYQTSNGITTKGAGNEHGAVGVVQYVSKEGLPITFTYVADENGYQPSGDHAIKHLERQLEYIRTHPSVDELQSRRW